MTQPAAPVPPAPPTAGGVISPAPAPRAMPSRLQLRPPTGLVAIAVLVVVCTAWLVGLYPLILIGDQLDFGFTTSNVFYLLLTTTLGATLLLALATAAVRSVWLSIVAMLVTMVHGASMLVMLIIQIVFDARVELVAEVGTGVGALVLAAIGTVLCLLAALRARRRFSNAPGLTIAAASVTGVAVVIGVIVPSIATMTVTAPPFGALLLATSVAVQLAAGLAGVRHRVVRVLAAVLAVVTAILILLVGVPSLIGFPPVDGWGSPFLVVDMVRIALLVVAAVLLIASMRGLARWRGHDYDPSAAAGAVVPSTAAPTGAQAPQVPAPQVPAPQVQSPQAQAPQVQPQQDSSAADGRDAPGTLP